jgi:hypothetical protein
MHTNIVTEQHSAPRGNRVRFWMYWISAVIATLVFLLFMATMLMVPGILSSTKMWMLSVAGGSVAISLVIGVWRFGSTEAPVMAWPLGALMGVVLLLELAECAIGVIRFAMTTKH